MTLKLSQLIKYEIRKIFMKKSWRKHVLKASPRPFSLNNSKQSLNVRKCFKIRYFKKELSKSHKNVNFIFRWNPIPYNGQNHEKQKRV